MHISIQYLEGGSHPTPPSTAEARACLRRAFERIPLQAVLLGWGLPQTIVAACAEECTRRGARLYLWHPFLSGGRGFERAPEWQVIGAGGDPVGGLGGLPEFTFMCPSNPQAREAALCNLDEALQGGPFQGVFLDRIRLPSPSMDPWRDLGCFCPHCHAKAARWGIDLAAIQAELRRRFESREGILYVLRALLSRSDAGGSLGAFLELRARAVLDAVREAAELIRSRRLSLGLDCFTPSLAAMVGQDLAALGLLCDWIKVMTYTHAYGPAGIPYELLGVIEWLITSAGVTEHEAIAFVAEATGWPLPASRHEIRRGRLSPAILSMEIGRRHDGGAPRLAAGVEMVDVPGVCEITRSQIEDDARALRSAGAHGVVLSWDLWFMPDERLSLAAALYGP